MATNSCGALQTPEEMSKSPINKDVVPLPELLDVKQTAALINCSQRHVYRLAGSGRMPAPVKLGQLVRWSRAGLEEWISLGCQPVTTEGEVTP